MRTPPLHHLVCTRLRKAERRARHIPLIRYGNSLQNVIRYGHETRRRLPPQYQPDRSMHVRGLATAHDVFLFPDSPLGELPARLELACAANEMRSLQIIVEATREVQMSINDAQFELEVYEMRAVPVEYNTGDGVEQGGRNGHKPRPVPAICDTPRAVLGIRLPFALYGRRVPARDGRRRCIAACAQ